MKITSLSLTFVCFVLSLQAQTFVLKMDLNEVENRFVEKNLLLLSAKYNINIAQLLEKQVRLWNNPTIDFEQNIYNPNTEKYFDMSNTGQTVVQVQQLILLAGKRNKQIALQKYNTTLTEYQFYDLMRTLRMELVSIYYQLYFSQQKLNAIESQIQPLRDLSLAYEEQQKKGNVSMKEVSRLNSLLFKLETERISLFNEELSFRANLKTLLAIKGDTTLEPQYQETSSAWLESKKIEELAEDAKTNRPDFQAYDTYVRLNQANLKLQKANAIPDITMGGAFDRAGSYINNYYAFTLGFSLPIFNRNQFGIKIAKEQIDQSQLEYQNLAMSLENEVSYSYSKALQLHQSYATFSKGTFDGIEQIQKAMMENYQKRNITLMEFVDYYESYKDNIISYLDLKLAREQALEELNFTIGRKVN